MSAKRQAKNYSEAASPARHSAESGHVIHDVNNPGDAFIQAEIDSNRRYEWVLIPKALAGLAVVAVLVVIRQVFFV
jgi:hypothetical protein